MNLHDVIEINAHKNDAAIVLDQGLANPSLVGNYMPTRASQKVFEHLTKAVSPSATQEQRAINLYGSYGSGKSHLAVVIAHLLKFGAASEGFDSLLSKFSSSKNDRLASNIKNTFLSDSDAKPYLFVSLYGSNTTSIGSKLLEGLYDAVEREDTLDAFDVLPKTEFDVCRERLQKVIESRPDTLNKDLDEYGITEYLDIESLLIGLESHENQAIQCFLDWHKQEFVGLDFNISSSGGKSFIEAYKEAGLNLYKNHGFAGIVILWDEFGHALEDLIKSPYRNSGEEIIQLQQFVETTCASDFGHTIFIGVTHVSFEEYGDRTNADSVVKDGLAKISGRFNTPFKIELSAAENEGYHLLGMQKSLTSKGKELAAHSEHNKDSLITSCTTLSMFDSLRDELNNIIYDTYPLHPALAVGLFNLAQLAAQANRTALTFFRDNASEILNTPLHSEFIWGQELIRLPMIIDFYGDKFRGLDTKSFQLFEKAIASISGNTKEEINRRKDILKLILLSNFLGENFQPSESYLSAILYDCGATSHHAKQLILDLTWLKDANLIWKNVATEYWKLTGEGGVSVDEIVEEALDDHRNKSLLSILDSETEVRSAFLPMLGFGNFEPSTRSGIIRSFLVSAGSTLVDGFNANDSVSTNVRLLLPTNNIEASELIKKIKEQELKEVYYWLPMLGVSEVKVKVEGNEKCLVVLLREYLAVDSLIKDKLLSDTVKSQLLAKQELLQLNINKIISKLFGKLGLSDSSSVIIKSGESTPITDITSWHDLKLTLEKRCTDRYAKDIPVRYMRMNYLLKNKDIGNEPPNTALIAKVTQRILDFASHPTYQTEYLGEESETSAESGVINGVLGKYSNNLFIERPEIDLKSLDELDGNIKEILSLIRKKLITKRETPFEVSLLVKELNAAPYGIPSCVIPILVALAIRTDQDKINFIHRDTNDGTALAKCLMRDSSLKVRVTELNNRQVSVLCLYGQALRELGLEGGEQRINYLPEQNLAKGFTKKIKQWFAGISGSTMNSKHISKNAKLLAKAFTTIGITNQELAQKTIEAIDVKTPFSNEKIDFYIDSLVKLLKEFSSIEDINRQILLDCWKNNFPNNESDILKVINYLNQVNTELNQLLIELVEKFKASEIVTAEDIVNIKYNIPLEECDDQKISEVTHFISFAFSQGVSFTGNIEPAVLQQPEQRKELFTERVKAVSDVLKGKSAHEVDEILKSLELKHNHCSSLLKAVCKNEQIVEEDLNLLSQQVVNKGLDVTNDSEKDEIIFRLRNTLNECIELTHQVDKSTPENFEKEVSLLVASSTLSKKEKLLIISKLMLQMQSDEL